MSGVVPQEKSINYVPNNNVQTSNIEIFGEQLPSLVGLKMIYNHLY